MTCEHGRPYGHCGDCQRRDLDMQAHYNANANARNEAMMRAQAHAANWPQNVISRLEKERDVAVTIAARLRVALEKIQAFAKRDEHWEILNECEGALESGDT